MFDPISDVLKSSDFNHALLQKRGMCSVRMRLVNCIRLFEFPDEDQFS